MNSFETLGLPTPVLKAISELGFENPTPIQEKVIPVLLEGSKDIVALAQTGTGKTAGFGLPMVSLVDFSARNTQALILAPTRELCMQITQDIKNFSKHMQGSNVVAVYGGASIMNQIYDLKRGAQIIVATPGRMVDIISRNKVDLSGIKFVVLDEADEMLNMGFQEDLDDILSKTPKEKNTWLFSATMPDEVLRISRKYMNQPVEITVGNKNQGNDNIEHVYYVTHERDRYAVLKRIADFHPDIFGLVFCRTKIETQKVADALIKDGYNADALHGDMSQAQRDHVMKRFRGRTLQMLVATDVAARGIDVNDITHVIHYQLPDEIENYTHRSGRTARAGKKGISIAIINTRDLGKIRTLERLTKKQFSHADIPNGYEICEKQLFWLVKKIHDAQVNEQSIESYLAKVYEDLADLSREEIIKRMVSIEFNRFLDYYKNAPDLNANAAGSREGREVRSSAREGMVRLFVSLGMMDNLNRDTMKEFLTTTANMDSGVITWIDVKNSFSFIEVKTETSEAFMNAFKGKEFKGRPIRIENRGNREEGIPRQRDRDGGGRGGFGGGRGRDGGSDRRRSGSRDGGFKRRSEYSSNGDRSAPPREGFKRDSGGSRDGGSREGGFRRDKDKKTGGDFPKKRNTFRKGW
ncbi:MAG TPA: DEAD/DEAH box helicase [Bacteroidia bacterium]|jgi:ATP-dependent RNA helicase DeaD|nr:DEAD/DEAH box helicase [Bacteroidia bacterium]